MPCLSPTILPSWCAPPPGPSGRCCARNVRRHRRLPAPFQSRRAFGIHSAEFTRLGDAPRFEKTPFHLLDRRIELTDAAGGAQCIHELFFEEIYRFRSSRPDPVILDCGANVGLSVIYFKQLYPDAEIIAFEPDARIFQSLENNVRAFDFSKVTLRGEAVWKEDGELHFVADGGFGGRTETGATPAGTTVKAVRLRDFLDRPITLLKIDIEGAETAVIADCHDRLANVERLFVEYHSRPGDRKRSTKSSGLLRRAGFRYSIKEAVRTPHPFIPEERRGEIYDLQLNVFASRD